MDEVYISSKQGDFHLSLIAGPDEVTVTGTSQTLEELGITIDPNIRKITLITTSTGIFWADGTASAEVNPFPAGEVEIECTPCTICTREFVTSGENKKMSIIQEGGG